MSDRDCWETPQELFDALDHEFRFDLDAAANASNAKCKAACIVEHTNALEVSWGGTVFLNPPYSNIGPWAQKAYGESLGGATVVCLLPVDTSTAWFWDWVQGKAEIRFLRKRVQFIPPPGVGVSGNNRPSMLAIYRPFGARL